MNQESRPGGASHHFDRVPAVPVVDGQVGAACPTCGDKNRRDPETFERTEACVHNVGYIGTIGERPAQFLFDQQGRR